MALKVAVNRYHALSIAAHWLTLALLVAVYALILLREVYPRGSDPREAMKTWHFMLGLTVFVIVGIRLLLRLVFRAPPITPSPPRAMRVGAAAMHLALYLFLIAMPLLGWLALSAKGAPIPFFGLRLPALIGPDETLGRNLEEVHETIGTVGYYLVGLHASVALFHHYLMRDDTLLRMLLRKRRVPAQQHPVSRLRRKPV
jgi:cytochrome b561